MLARPLSLNEARAIVADMATWQVVVPTVDEVQAAIDGTARWQVSFWDAMVVVAASRADAAVLWSEDLSDGQTYDGLTARNPFRDVL